MIWALGAVSLKLDIVHLRVWSPDFNPKLQKSTNVHVWVCFYLNSVLWHPKILFDFARYIGVPLKFDQNTSSSEFRHYAGVLADVDHASFLLKSLLINRACGSITIGLIF